MIKRLDDRVMLGTMTVRNRLVLPPLTTNMGDERGRVTPEILRFYKARSGQVGIVIVEAAAVSPEGRIIPNSIGIWEEGQKEGLAELAQAIKASGARAVIQINHAGAKAWPFEGMAAWMAPSDVACRPGVVAEPASLDRIAETVQAFARAAARAKAAGFDGVEVHGAHLYLISQFLSPLTNRRTDEYGGTVQGRAKLAVEIVRAVRDRLGPGYPVFFRLNVLENLEGGLTPDQALEVGRLLAGAGTDVLDLSLAVQGTWQPEGGQKVLITTSAYAKDQTPGAVTGLAERFRSGCGLPVIAVGRLGSRAQALGAVAAGADLVAIGRQMICDPKTAEKILADKDSEILECEACQSCFAALGKGKPIQCKKNKNLPD